MAEPPDSLAQLITREQLAAAEERALNAEIAREVARRKAAVILASADRDNRVAALNAEATLAEAEAAAAAARLQKMTASIGAIPTSGIAGVVTLGDGAGSLETALLAARAASQASGTIAMKVRNAVRAKNLGLVLVIASGELPTFQAARAFSARAALAENALIDATETVPLKESAPSGERLAAAESIGAVGVALDAVTKLLSFFRSDFEVRGVALDADQPLLATSVAGALVTAFAECPDPRPQVRLVGTFTPSSVKKAGAAFRREMRSLAFQREKARTVLAALQRELASFGAEADAPASTEPKARQQSTIERLTLAITGCDAFTASLNASECPLDTIVRELDVLEELSATGSAHLYVTLEKAGGSSYVQKNVWTVFGMLPYSIAGGVVVSYRLIQASTSSVLAAGVLPVHGGFVGARDVGARLREAL